jgi:transglutaminase-like putative cysteine protease
VISTEPRNFSHVAWLVLAMSMATLPFIGSMPPWLTLGLIVLATWRLLAEHRGLVVVPPLPVRLLLALLVAALLLVTGSLGFGLAAATPLFVGFLWIKLLELKARRDHLLAGVLCYFLVAVLLFDRQSLLTCLYAIATLGAITVAMVSYHLDAGARRAFALGTRLLLQGLPLAAAIFLLFPRFHLTLPNLGGQALSGFSDQITPGDVARMALSEEVMMRVVFPNDDLPAMEQLYWRGLVLSETDGRTWRVARDPGAYIARPIPGSADLPEVVQEFTLQPNTQRWLFALDVADEAPERTRLLFNRALVRRSAPTQVLRYRVRSRLGDLASDVDSASNRLPPDLDPRLGALAQEWRQGAGSARTIAERGMAWFRSRGFTYSLSPGAMEGDDAADFLFNKRTGFCAHYATAFALVMRSAGVPARVVVGFRGGERNPYGDFLLLRQDHAHAWCEANIEGRWHRFDPTLGIPPAAGETQPAVRRTAEADPLSGINRSPSWMPEWLRGPYGAANQWMAVADAKWESTVMGFDGTAQGDLLARLGLQRSGPLVLFGLVLVVLAVVVVGMLLAPRLLPQRRKAADPLLVAYHQWCRRLAHLGVTRQAWEGPQDFATRAAGLLPAHAAAIGEAAGSYIALRYGAPGDRAALMARFSAAIRALPRHAPAGASAPARSG